MPASAERTRIYAKPQSLALTQRMEDEASRLRSDGNASRLRSDGNASRLRSDGEASRLRSDGNASRLRSDGEATLVMLPGAMQFQESTLVMARPAPARPAATPAPAPAPLAVPVDAEMTRFAPAHPPPSVMPGPMVSAPMMMAPMPTPPPPSVMPVLPAGFVGMPGSALLVGQGAPPMMPALPPSLASVGPSGLSPAVAFALSAGAVVVALVFDALFLRVHIPGVGGYAWYLTTALSFGVAGFGGAKWTRARAATVSTAAVLAAVAYGLADVALGTVVEHLSVQSALFLGAQGLVIGLVCGAGGVRKGLTARG
ncbi:MAG: hypothetical protein HOO96_17880 [Polyangiaceae bacterium]|nr:hypothetical protein [Polyangiaceae bacterium]